MARRSQAPHVLRQHRGEPHQVVSTLSAHGALGVQDLEVHWVEVLEVT
jgi:hypothetical protein